MTSHLIYGIKMVVVYDTTINYDDLICDVALVFMKSCLIMIAEWLPEDITMSGRHCSTAG